VRLILLLALIGASVGIKGVLKRDLVQEKERGSISVKADPLRGLFPQISPFLADILWVKVVQTYGERGFKRRATEEDWKELYRWTKAVTELDPNFFIPYYFAGVIFPWESDLVHEAIWLDKKGMIYIPNEWRLPFLVGFNLFYFLGKKKDAALYLRRAVRLNGSPPYLPRLVARLLYESGETESALLFLKEMLKETTDLRIREQLEKRKAALERVLYLERAINNFKERFGREPRYLEELVERGVLRWIPPDPYGGQFYWDSEEKRVKSTSNFLPMEVNKDGNLN
jgi:tetratricopeptide (TPR) repeat protein